MLFAVSAVTLLGRHHEEHIIWTVILITHLDVDNYEVINNDFFYSSKAWYTLIHVGGTIKLKPTSHMDCKKLRDRLVWNSSGIVRTIRMYSSHSIADR